MAQNRFRKHFGTHLRARLWTAVWIVALTLSTLSYQQCSPAQFSASNASLSKAEGELSLGDGAPVDEEDSSDDSESPAEVCVERREIEIQHADGIPMARCLKNSGEMCAVICHVPPGNPAAQHTILISPNAVQAHLNHGSKAQAKGASTQCSDKKSSRQPSSKQPESNLPDRDYLGECKSPVEPTVCQ